MEGQSIGHIFAELGARFNPKGFTEFDKANKAAVKSTRASEKAIEGSQKATQRYTDSTKRATLQAGQFVDAQGRLRNANGRYVKGTYEATRGNSALAGSLKRLAVAAGGTYAVGQAMRFIVSETSEAQKVASQTDATLKSTGASAWISAQQINEYAGALSAKTGVDDEAIQSGQNLLLTFAKIQNKAGEGNDIFNQATTAATDLSIAFGKDMSSSSIMLGKALNDPVKGITALTRVGVSFDEGMKKQIISMSESGNVLGAQKLILAEVNKQVAGSAEAYGKTLPGQIAKARNALGNLAANIGEKVAPHIEKAAAFVGKLFEEFQKGEGAGGKIRAFFNDVVAAAKSVGQVFFELGKTLMPVVIPALLGIAAAVQGLLRGFNALPKPVKEFIVLFAVGALVIPKVVVAIQAVKMALIAMRAAVLANPIGLLLTAIAVAAYLIIKNWGTIGPFFEKIAKAIGNALASAWRWIKNAARDAFNFVANMARKGLLGPIPFIIANWGKIVSFFKSIPGSIAKFFSRLPGRVAGYFEKMGQNIVNTIRNAINWVIRLVASLPGRIGNALKDAGKSVVEGGKNLIGKVNPFATGGLVSGPQIGLVGEAGPEVIIPLSGKYQNRGRQLLALAAEKLGVMPFAAGGIVGLRKRAAQLSRERKALDSRYSYRSREAQLDGVVSPSEQADLLGIKRKQESVASTEQRTLEALIKAYGSDLRALGTKMSRTKNASELKKLGKDRTKLEEGLKAAREQLAEVRQARQDANLDRRQMEFEQSQAAIDTLAQTPFDTLIRNLQRMLGITNTDQTLTAADKAKRVANIQAQLKQAGQSRLDLLRQRFLSAPDQATKDAVGGALDDAISFMDQFNQAESNAPSFAEQVLNFNNARMEMLRSFGSNFAPAFNGQRGTANGNKVINISQTFTREPANAHSWTQQIEHYLASAA